MEPYLPQPPQSQPPPPPFGHSGPTLPPAAPPPPFGGPGFSNPGFARGPYAPMPVEPRTPGLAIAALVCGIVGVFLFFVFAILPILALWFGIASSRQITTSGGRLKGRGFARTGIILGILGIIGFGVFAWAIATDRIDTSDKSTSDELSVGDCIKELPDEGLVFDDFEVTPCSGVHVGEVYFIGQLNGADAPAFGNDYPGESEAARQVEQLCVTEFESFVGKAYDLSIYDVYYVAPSKAGWDALDGEYTCILYDEGKSLTGSARDAGE